MEKLYSWDLSVAENSNIVSRMNSMSVSHCGLPIVQSERKNVGARRDRHILPPIQQVRHRRRLPSLIGFEVPQRAAGLGVHGGEASAGLAVKDNATNGGQHARIVR